MLGRNNTIDFTGWWHMAIVREVKKTRFELEDLDLEKGSEKMEKDITEAMRKRSDIKVRTWDGLNGTGESNMLGLGKRAHS